ncbi:hypothetical protein ACFE04_003052 [Oxalis oulophora]
MVFGFPNVASVLLLFVLYWERSSEGDAIDIVEDNHYTTKAPKQMLVCLRVHRTFSLLHPTESFVSFTSINGSKHEIGPESGEQVHQGDCMPNGDVNLELWSEDRPVSKESPLEIHHEYEVTRVS